MSQKKTFEEAKAEIAEKFGGRIELVEYEASGKPCVIRCVEGVNGERHGEQKVSKYYTMSKTAYGCPKCNTEVGSKKKKANAESAKETLAAVMEQVKAHAPELLEDEHFGELIAPGIVYQEEAKTFVRKYNDVRFMGGDGCDVEVNEEPEMVQFDETVLKRNRVKAENVACFPMYGDSMQPTIPEGALVAIDEGAKTNIVNGKIYAVLYKGKRRVKRVSKLNKEMLTLQSDNPKYEVENLFASSVQILGRVFWQQSDL